jgi:hypothetical protein
MLTNVTNGTIRKKQLIAFKRLMLGRYPSLQISNYIGLGFSDLKKWLIPYMHSGMNWNNYGEIWVVEPLVPLLFFDLSKEENCRLVWNYKNLMPIYIKDLNHIREQSAFALRHFQKMDKCAIVESLINTLKERIKEQEKYL